MWVLNYEYATFKSIPNCEWMTLTPSHKCHEGVSNQDRMSS
ncbi:hypothetical protein [Staphylococcus argensis]|nr:hypothetical protein [Staphylococcus argensis]